MTPLIADTCYLLGSGASVKEGIEQGLFDKLKGKYVFGLNSSYLFFDSPVLIYLDWFFYEARKQDIDKRISIIGYENSSYRDHKITVAPHIWLLRRSRDNKYYGADAWTKGFYSPILVGIWAINVAIALGFKNIYLLGYDWCATNGETHFYPKFTHSDEKTQGLLNKGIGQTPAGKYNTPVFDKNPIKWFLSLEDENKTHNIYNVSLQSKIETFPKINYEQFFEHLVKNPDNFDHYEIHQNLYTIIDEKLPK